jgi:hypothetical protein
VDEMIRKLVFSEDKEEIVVECDRDYINCREQHGRRPELSLVFAAADPENAYEP